jgi:AAHS family 4-hydroxybenzoate transporter-like MFS transporter
MAGAVIDIPALIDRRPVGRFQYGVAALCALTVFLDGFDTQSIAFVAPSIVKEWHTERAALAPIFSASVVGLLVGALLFGPVADRIGRRSVIMICTALFGVMTLVTACSTDVTELLIFRFVTGIGLGGAMPNAIALTAEYCPQRRRATLVMVMFTGFSLGSFAGGILAAFLIEDFGWRSVWYVGGALPVLLLPLQYRALPESIRFLVIANAPGATIARLLRRIAPDAAIAPDTRFDIGELRAPGVPVVQLFGERRAWGTVCLWVMFFMNLLDLFFLQNWIPVLTNADGVALRTAVIIGALFQLGGVIAAPVIGLAVDRWGGCRVLPVLYGAGCLVVALLGQAGASVPVLTVLTFGAGACLVGAQNSANALAAMFYPTAMRATGVGWSLGIGRIGAIIGPLLAGFLLSLHWANGSLFLLGGLPPAVAMAAVLVMGRRYGADPGRRTAEAPPGVRATV